MSFEGDRVLLGKEDENEWQYVGEGAVNLVFSYRGSDPRLRNYALRIPKVAKRMIIRLDYMRKIVGQVVGYEYIPKVHPVIISKPFCNVLLKISEPHRPRKRILAFSSFKESLDKKYIEAWLIEDLTKIDNAQNVITFEIKPKWGKDGDSESGCCRFCKHQLLKHSEQNLSKLSLYCPLDLFNFEYRDSILHCMKKTPQNNLRVFLNGVECHDFTSFEVSNALDKLVRFLEEDPHKEFNSILQKICQMHGDPSELEIKKVYQECYKDLSSEEKTTLEEEMQNGKWTFELNQHSLNSKEILKRFLIGMTMKDVSIMISFPHSCEFDQDTLPRPKFGIVDVDCKDLSKMEHWYIMDSKIRENWRMNRSRYLRQLNCRLLRQNQNNQ